MSRKTETVQRTAIIRVPASTSNLGSAFDAVGLALELHLTLRIHELREGPSRLEVEGVDLQHMPADSSNFIWRTLEDVASMKGWRLPPFL